ncbi:MAG: hypothetical protein JXM72_00385 [Deltaproteobacteria bacterium]|nr:hypothetical protein [Deltaproteobacteria bacterium]
MKFTLRWSFMLSLLVLLGFSNSMGMNVSLTAGAGFLDGHIQKEVSDTYVNTDGTPGDQVVSHEVRFPADSNAASVRAETEIGRFKLTLDATRNMNKGSGRIKEGIWEVSN